MITATPRPTSQSDRNPIIRKFLSFVKFVRKEKLFFLYRFLSLFSYTPATIETM